MSRHAENPADADAGHEPPMTLDEALTQLHRAIAGDDPGFARALAAAREASGVPDDEVPDYLPRAIATLADPPSRP